jgi:hypothetical protein
MLSNFETIQKYEFLTVYNVSYFTYFEKIIGGCVCASPIMPECRNSGDRRDVCCLATVR